MTQRLKITAGIHSIAGYEAAVEAGADECFAGYIPHDWYDAYGIQVPMNRREVRYYNTQISAWGDMEILAEMSRRSNVPVAVALNALSYPPETYEKTGELVKRLQEIGFDRIIAADPGLIDYLGRNAIPCAIHLSGEFGVLNRKTLELAERYPLKRVIFHRNTSFADMRTIRNLRPDLEYEAFFLNEKCHFTGAYCNTLHCDELLPMCRVPYELISGSAEIPIELPETEEEGGTAVIGSGGCGICSLPELSRAGVTHLKIVGRGKPAEAMKRDIEAVRRLRDGYLTDPERYSSFIGDVFRGSCSNDCYYR